MTAFPEYANITNANAAVAELADALDSGSSGSNIVGVQVPSAAPKQYDPNQIFVSGDGFGLFVFFEKFEDRHFRSGVAKRPEAKPFSPSAPALCPVSEIALLLTRPLVNSTGTAAAAEIILRLTD